MPLKDYGDDAVVRYDVQGISIFIRNKFTGVFVAAARGILIV